MSDEAPDPKELREAEALARALEGEAVPDAPTDALEVAALLRYAEGRTLLSAAELEQAKQGALVVPIARVWRRRVIALSAVMSAAAVVTLAFLSTQTLPPAREHAQPTVSATGKPSDALSTLLEAQAAALSDPNRDLSALSLATRPRRSELLLRVEAQLGAEP